MPVVPFIPMIIGAAGSVGAAAITAHTAKTAAEQETAGAQKALDLQTQMYNQSRQDYAPYRQVGAQALPQLTAYAGAPVVQHNAGRQGYSPGYQPGMTLAGMTNGMGGGGMGGTMARLAPVIGGTPTGGSAMGSAPPGSDLVTLVDDQGQPRQVSRAMAQKYLALGARQVS